MRIGFNPNKDVLHVENNFSHQVVVPVHIPHFDSYFKDSFKIFKLCLESLFKTTHRKTYFTIVNNGSHPEIQHYLDSLLEQKKIHEIIHTSNIGKLNAILKGIVGHQFQLITISDSDVLFLEGWQNETNSIFSVIPRVGVVGIVPQFGMFKANSGNVLTENVFFRKLKFLPVKNSDALVKFYESIGWDKSYNQDYLKYTLGLEWNKHLRVLVGSGHFVATYRGSIFKEVASSLPFKMGGNSESYLDEACLKFDYWRVTTYDNYAYHMGNTIENWMVQIKFEKKLDTFEAEIPNNEPKKISKFSFFLKNKIIYKLLKIAAFKFVFYKYKKLPKNMISDY